jgi:hypothetical protein
MSEIKFKIIVLVTSGVLRGEGVGGLTHLPEIPKF